MARTTRNVSDTPDAFDNPPEGPIGVHRGNRAWYSVLLPYLVVLIVSAFLGFLAWAVLSGEIQHWHMPWSHKQVTTTQTVAKKEVKSEDKKNQEDEEDDKDSEKSNTKDSKSSDKDSSDKDSSNKNESSNENTSDSNNNAGTANKSVAVKVINGTKTQGYAAKNAEKLKSAGFTNVSAGNPSGKVPSDSVVWYKDEANKATAEEVAKTLGISNVEKEPGILSPITVVLCK